MQSLHRAVVVTIVMSAALLAASGGSDGTRMRPARRVSDGARGARGVPDRAGEGQRPAVTGWRVGRSSSSRR